MGRLRGLQSGTSPVRPARVSSDFAWATLHESIDVIQVTLDVIRSLFESRSETDMDPSVMDLEFSLFAEPITTNEWAGAKRFDYRGTFAELPDLFDAVQAAIRFS